MRMPYRSTLAESREGIRRFLGLFRFETKQGALYNGPGILDSWIVPIVAWAAVLATLVAIVAVLLGPAE
jgi:hypothetical protein